MRIGVKRDDVGHDFVNTCAGQLSLRGIEGISNHDETIAMEQPYGLYDLAGFQHLESDDSVVCREMFAQSDDVRLVGVARRIGGDNEQMVVRLDQPRVRVPVESACRFSVRSRRASRPRRRGRAGG